MSELTKIVIKEQSRTRLITRRFFRHRLAGFAIAVLIILILSAVFAYLSPYTSTEQDPINSFQSASSAHWLGTDELGRDIFTRLLYGGRVSLAVGLLSTLTSISIGVIIGALAGYFGGWLDRSWMWYNRRIFDIPTLFVLILLGAFLREQPLPWLKNSIFVVIIIIAILSWMWPARLVRSLVLVLREREFVTAAHAVGANSAQIILRHILPNCIGPILVSATLQMAYAIITESGLSYLGFGVQPPTPTWGSLLSTAQVHVFKAPWMAFYPGLMIFITVMTINYIGDGLRDAFDPYVTHTGNHK